jgi:hypothetical protein
MKFILASLAMVLTFPTGSKAMADSDAKVPERLSDSDWSGIWSAYEHNRYAIEANPGGTRQARNPSQTWVTKFDGRGFTVTPDAGGWSSGLKLAEYGEVSALRPDGGTISLGRGDGLTEWFVNDARGLEQGWTLAKRPDRAGTGGAFRLNLAVRGSIELLFSRRCAP